MNDQPTYEEWASPSDENNECHDVRELYLKFGLLTAVKPGHLTKRKLRERIQCMMEELNEFAVAAGARIEVLSRLPIVVFNTNADQDLAGQADALVDLVYFALGTAVMLGLPWQKLWDDVHRANMTKILGVKPGRGHAVDLVKPPGWVGPQTHQILAEAGYDRCKWAEQTRDASGITYGNINEGVCRDDA